MGFFTLLAFTPFPLDMNAHQVGLIFFGWGLLLAITSVWVAPILQRMFGSIPTVLASLVLFGLDLVAMAVWTDHKGVLVAGVVVAGAFLGVNNTVITEAVMGAAPVERPVASAAYSFVRFSGGAVGAVRRRQARRERQRARAVLDGRGRGRDLGRGALRGPPVSCPVRRRRPATVPPRPSWSRSPTPVDPGQRIRTTLVFAILSWMAWFLSSQSGQR